ncbi:phosphatidylinositol 3-kinase catalytic subunit type 3-like [Ruditapes philippinarum]|uniref:phosphatidylinositol 3-kinase catalytic subunit type 3-like n=1 Tax=Ruditapes philippinarum TaxID=129788 RepID=UPI00295B3249|nr:phosphatidylinositol 3-kinase catalytic subunit type 3-like [Ruditapes philippinarum]
MSEGRFNYIYSCELEENVEIKIGTLEGERERPSYNDLLNDPMLRYSGVYCEGCSDLYVSCQVYSNGMQISLPCQTSYKAFSTRYNWNEWIQLPIKYSDLPRDAVLSLTVWDIYGTDKVIPVGGTTIFMFGKKGTFRQGMHDLKVWPDVEADPGNQSTTPGKSRDSGDQMSRLAKLSKRHRDGHMVKVDWLDRLTFREIEMVNERQKRDSNFMYLMIEFPRIHFSEVEYAIIYFEKGGDDPHTFTTHGDLVIVPDPEISLENLVEAKHHKLARSLRSGPTDKDMKPDAKIRDWLNTIVGYPPTKQMSSEEQDLVWKYRFYLSSQKKALTKFLKCVNWNQTQEVKQALELLSAWNPMDVEDALELLTPTFSHPVVRKYAVNRLRQADDEDLLLYLLQLVQALKYEDFEQIKKDLDTAVTPVRRDSVSLDDSPQQTEKYPAPVLTRTTSHDSILDELGTSPRISESPESKLEKEMDLATFLISRASHNLSLANYFFWYLMVESEDHESEKDQKTKDMYYSVFRRFSDVLVKGGQDCRHRRAMLIRQQTFMDKLVNLVRMVMRESGNRKKKIEKLQALLQDSEVCKINFSDFEALPLPLDPDIKVNAISPESASLFKSNLMPCRLAFHTTDDKSYITIFKHGDDLRQDQLMLQMFTLMDRLLRQENLDLKLTPYKVLATSTKHGFVQFVESLSVAEVLDKEVTIQNYFRKQGPCEGAPYGIQPEVMDNYVKSCAGYCVVTYLLGVGDRHLDNLLLTNSGKLFHIDFGYILGRDPKPLPPPMKLSKEMVEAMGGSTSDHFKDFKQHCYTAFLALRRSANLILNLFSLMVDANIPDIALEPDKTVKKVQDKFVLHLTDEEAVAYLQNLIDESVSAMMAALVEQIHKMAQYWRK